MFLRNRFLAAAAVITAAWPCASQPVTWSAPVLDYVYDTSSNTIKTVSGVPGAASIDAVVPSSVKLHRAHVAPGRKFAVVQTVDEGTVLLDWSSGEVSMRELTGAITDITSVAFSSRGNVAAIASASAGKVQIWRGLPDSPAIAQEIASDAGTFAVSDDGAIAGIQTDGVYLIGADEKTLLASGTFSAIAFRPGAAELAAAGKFSDTIVSLRTRGGETFAQTLASSDNGIAEPVGLQFSTDGLKLVIANLRGRSATIVDVSARTATTIDCDCNPSLVSVGTGNAVFRITGSSGSDSSEEPLVFLDANSAEPRIFLVPVTGVSR